MMLRLSLFDYLLQYYIMPQKLQLLHTLPFSTLPDLVYSIISLLPLFLPHFQLEILCTFVIMIPAFF